MTRTDAPAPMRRRGPRPLLMHLALAAGRPLAGAAPPGAAAPAESPPAWLDPALLAGIAAYRRHPYHRDLPDPPVLWSEGDTRLLDLAPGSTGPVVLAVPSLVNRAYVLDLREGRSLLRFLAGAGLRPLLLDWGWPGPDERAMDLAGYVARLERAAAAAPRGPDGAVPALLGYCMGGLLCLAALARRPGLARALALLAVPWDFHAPEREAALALAGLLPLLEPALAATGTLPVDALQWLFGVPQHESVAARFRGFATAPQDGERARDFVALEDWLSDGVPLAAPVARECLGGWYGRNEPALGRWRVGGTLVQPERLRLPALVAVPSRDRVVPAEGALPLAERLHGAALLRPGAGHVGMVAGAGAEAALWGPLAEWLKAK